MPVNDKNLYTVVADGSEPVEIRPVKISFVETGSAGFYFEFSVLSF